MSTKNESVKKNLEDITRFLRNKGIAYKLKHKIFRDDKHNIVNKTIFFPGDNIEPKILTEDQAIAADTDANRLKYKGKHRFAVGAIGYSVAQLTIGDNVYVGRAICSNKDSFYGNIGSVIAINNAIKTYEKSTGSNITTL